MRRPRTTAVLAVTVAVAVATAVGGCGVQPTGVNVASTTLFSVSGSSGSPSASTAGGGSQAVTIYLMSKGLGYPREAVRYVPKPPTSPLDLLSLLKDEEVTSDDRANNLVTYVTDDIRLAPTGRQAHEFQIFSDQKPSTTALRQMACTFDLYWRAHPDGQNFSTQFILPSGYENGWDDCQVVFGEDAPAATGKQARTPTSAVPSIGGPGR
ncbi:MAG: hypothetical protein ACJ786_28660 [Catenulispora sp.]